MEDLIKRSDAIKVVKKYRGLGITTMAILADAIRAIPSTDRPVGEWTNFFAGKDDEWLRSDGIPMFLVCNKCHGIVMSSASARWDFCPNCGADMREVRDE